MHTTPVQLFRHGLRQGGHQLCPLLQENQHGAAGGPWAKAGKPGHQFDQGLYLAGGV